jgi:hypothetical protein
MALALEADHFRTRQTKARRPARSGFMKSSDGYRLMVRRATRATLKMTVAIPAASKGQRLFAVRLDDRFHETGGDGTDDLLADSSFAIG